MHTKLYRGAIIIFVHDFGIWFDNRKIIYHNETQ